MGYDNRRLTEELCGNINKTMEERSRNVNKTMEEHCRNVNKTMEEHCRNINKMMGEGCENINNINKNVEEFNYYGHTYMAADEGLSDSDWIYTHL